MTIYELSEETRIQFFLQAHFALLERIIPKVRAVSIDYDGDTIYLCVYFESELTEEDQEEFDIAATEIIAGLIEMLLIAVQFFVVPASKELAVKGFILFQRKEPGKVLNTIRTMNRLI